LVLLSIGLAGPGWAASSKTSVAVARYSYDGSGDALMLIRGSVQMGPGALFVLVSVDDTSPQDPVVFFPQVIDLASADGVRSYGQAGQHSLCTAPLTCQVRGDTFSFGVSNSVEGDGKNTIHLRSYIAVRGVGAAIHDGGMIGWKAKHRSSGLLTRADTDAAGVGADVENTDIGVMTGITAPGQRGGSIAILVPDCDSAGAGVLTFAGGRQSQTVICPTGAVGDIAAKTTTWSATGATIGASANQTRLVVLAT
jgi:hypothetical protein